MSQRDRARAISDPHRTNINHHPSGTRQRARLGSRSRTSTRHERIEAYVVYAGTYGYHRARRLYARTGQAETANRAMTTPSSAEIAAMMRLAIAAITKAPVCVWETRRVGPAQCGRSGRRSPWQPSAVRRDLALKAASCGEPAWPEPCRQLVDIARRLQLRQRRREWWPRPAASQHLAVLARPRVLSSHV